VIRERGRHDDLAHVMHKAGDVIRVIRWRLHATDDFARHDGNADAMLPELAPRKRRVPGHTGEIFDDRRDHRQLADLPDAEIEHGFLDVIDGRAEPEIDRVDQAQQARGEAGIAADDLGNLMRVAAVAVEQVPASALSMLRKEGRRAQPLTRSSINARLTGVSSTRGGTIRISGSAAHTTHGSLYIVRIWCQR
jgi:hypothetical protein